MNARIQSVPLIGVFEMKASGWLSWMVNPAVQMCTHDYVVYGLSATIKWALPNKLPILLPAYIQEVIWLQLHMT